MRSLISIFVLLLALTSCGQKPITLTINGTVTDPALNGKSVYLKNYSTYKNIDTAVVVDSKFTFKVSQDTTTILGISLNNLYIDLILEDGVVDVQLIEVSEISGTRLNDLLNQYDKKFRTLKERSLRKELYENMFDNNIGNMLGVFSLWMLINEPIAYDEANVMVTRMGPLAENFGPIKSIMKAKAAYENTQAGKMYIDFDAVNPDGSAAKLSDYVGKGNYVLVDFWASWCGPCVREMPNIKEVYENYKDKGLVVLGVNVWDKKEKQKSIEKLRLDWNHIAIFEGTKATDAYGIDGIPHIILFAPDGKIVARGLHGDDMKAKVAECINILLMK